MSTSVIRADGLIHSYDPAVFCNSAIAKDFRQRTFIQACKMAMPIKILKEPFEMESENNTGSLQLMSVHSATV